MEYHGFSVVYVDDENQIHPSHSDTAGLYQEWFETVEQARDRKNELLETVGGAFEVVQSTLSFQRF